MIKFRMRWIILLALLPADFLYNNASGIEVDIDESNLKLT